MQARFTRAAPQRARPDASQSAGFARRVRDITGGEGVAAVYDGIGKTTFYEGLDAIRPFGRMIMYGSASGQPDPLPGSAFGA